MVLKHTQQLDSDSRAVSPVIGVVLMVGIVVALGAVVGAAALGVGVGVGDTAPNAQFDVSVEYDDSGQPVTFTVEHVSGETIESDRLEYSIDGEDDILETSPSNSFPDEVSAGDSVTLGAGFGESLSADDVFTMRWVSEDGESSYVLVTEVL